MTFFRDLLKMTPLRHEEFDEGCEAACNGPYDNKWSKTMIGYGPEDTKTSLTMAQQIIYPNFRCDSKTSPANKKLSAEEVQGIKKSVPNGFDNRLVCSGN